MSDYSDHQLEIYLDGLRGKVPKIPIAPEELRAAARQELASGPYGYVAGGAGDEETASANEAAFRKWRIVPRMLRDVNRRDWSTRVLRTSSPAPVWLAPVGVLGIVHDEAELAVATAAATLGLPMVLSTVSSYTLEEVAEAGGNAPRWFQLYWPGDETVTTSLMQRAEAAGYEAIVVTLDAALLGWRPRDLMQGYLPFLKGQGLANYFSDPAFRALLTTMPEENPEEAITRWATIIAETGHTWSDLQGLREATGLPILLKGILHPDDACAALDTGIDGLIVSNHGGRQIAGAIAALDALPAVLKAVSGRVPVMLDSGIRQGSDIVVALALGADAVLVGRPYVWGLALEGARGVTTVLQRLLTDLDVTAALCGCRGAADLDRSILFPSV